MSLTTALRKRDATVSGVLAAIVFLVGCQKTPTTGGDIPVTTERLSGSRLTDIHNDVSWTFSDSVVVIENKNQPIPSELIQELLGNESTRTIIKAAWQLDEKDGILRLFNAQADGETINLDLRIWIRPAGHVRVNLGSRQYNVFRNSTKDP